jgi:hypothetical protein
MQGGRFVNWRQALSSFDGFPNSLQPIAYSLSIVRDAFRHAGIIPAQAGRQAGILSLQEDGAWTIPHEARKTSKKRVNYFITSLCIIC